MAAVPAAQAALNASSVQAATRQGAQLAAATPGPTSKVIVIMRDTAGGLAPRSTARRSALLAEETPLLARLRAGGGSVEFVGKALPLLVASVTPAQRSALESNPLVEAVLPDSTIPYPASEGAGSGLAGSAAVAQLQQAGSHQAGSHQAARATTKNAAPSICGTSSSPEVDPQAVSAIKALAAINLGYDGAGVEVADVAGPIDTTILRPAAEPGLRLGRLPGGHAGGLDCRLHGRPRRDAQRRRRRRRVR